MLFFPPTIFIKNVFLFSKNIRKDVLISWGISNFNKCPISYKRCRFTRALSNFHRFQSNVVKIQEFDTQQKSLLPHEIKCFSFIKFHISKRKINFYGHRSFMMSMAWKRPLFKALNLFDLNLFTKYKVCDSRKMSFSQGSGNILGVCGDWVKDLNLGVCWQKNTQRQANKVAGWVKAEIISFTIYSWYSLWS